MQVRSLIRGSVLAMAAMAVATIGHERKDDFEASVITRRASEDYLKSREIFELYASQSSTFANKELISFEGDINNSLEGKICKAYIPPYPEGKPVYILVLGHIEELNISPKYSAMKHFYEKLIQEQKGTVLLFRTGLVSDELEHMMTPEEEHNFEPNKVLAESKGILGDFINKFKPRELRLGGFSWGGGTVYELSKDDNWRHGTPVMRTVMVDPISFGSFGLGAALRRRPEFKDSPEHKNFHVYQRKDDVPLKEWFTTLQGNFPVKLVKGENDNFKAVKDERPGDVIWQVPNTTHMGIDGLEEVRQKAYEFLTSQ